MHISRTIIVTLVALSSLAIETHIPTIIKRIHQSYKMTRLTNQQKKEGWPLLWLNQFLYYNEDQSIDYTIFNPSLCLDILLLRNNKKQKAAEKVLLTLIETYNHAATHEEKQQAKIVLKDFIQRHQAIPDNKSFLALQKNSNRYIYTAIPIMAAGATLVAAPSLITYFLIKRYRSGNSTQVPDTQEPIIVPNMQPIGKNTLRITNTIDLQDTRKWVESTFYTGWKAPTQFTITINGKKLRKNESIDIAKTDPITVVYEHIWQESLPFRKKFTVVSGEHTIQYAQPNTQNNSFTLAFNAWVDNKECIAIQPPLQIKSSVTTQLYLNPILKKLGFIK